MAQFTIVVDSTETNADIHAALSPAGTGLSGNMSAPSWLQNLSQYFGAASLGAKNLSISYTDSDGTTIIRSGL